MKMITDLSFYSSEAANRLADRAAEELKANDASVSSKHAQNPPSDNNRHWNFVIRWSRA